MNYQNGLIKYYFEIIIKCDSHEQCLHISKKIRSYLNVWDFCAEISYESKSARTGTVLRRSTTCSITNYSSNIIAFREALRCLIFHYDTLLINQRDSSVRLIDREMLPENSSLHSNH